MSETFNRLCCNPAFQGGAPKVRGSAISVTDILHSLAEGDRPKDVAAVLLCGDTEPVIQALAYAAAMVEGRSVTLSIEDVKPSDGEQRVLGTNQIGPRRG